MTITTITSSVEITPALMAEAFWNMGSDEQANFFLALYDLVKEDAAKPKSWAWSLGEMQWLYLDDELEKNKPAKAMLMAMAAPAYMHALRAIDGAA